MKIALLTLFFFISFLACFSQIKLDSGLVAYYPFNGNAVDESGNGNNAIFNNATLTNDESGIPNSAFHFNGIDNYIQVPNSPSLNMTNQMSISLKVKPLGFYTGPCYNNMMVMKGDADYVLGDYFIRFSDVITGCSTPTTTGEQFYGTGIVATTPIVQLGQWYSVTWTYDGTTASIYVNCVLASSTIASITSFSNSFDLFMGRLNDAQYPYWLNGDLDQVRIYNRALNVQEVNALCLTSPLPVSLTSFRATILDKKIKLNWNVEVEDGVSNYTIERSITGHSDFLAIGRIPANNIHSYSFVDNNVNVNQMYYYRLMLTKNDGAVSYSEVKTAKISNNKILIVYPNPSKGNIIIKTGSYNGSAEFTVTNPIGQLILQKTETIVANTPIPLQLNNQAKGVYWLRVKTSSDEFMERIILQ